MSDEVSKYSTIKILPLFFQFSDTSFDFFINETTINICSSMKYLYNMQSELLDVLGHADYLDANILL